MIKNCVGCGEGFWTPASKTKYCTKTCYLKNRINKPHFKDLTGKCINQILFLEYIADNYWWAKCYCGRIFRVRAIKVRMKTTRSCGCFKESRVGPLHPSWNPELTDEERIYNSRGTDCPKKRVWRRKIYSRDNYTCKVCDRKGEILNAHHMDGYHWCKESRFDITNGVTLCVDCHKKFHKLHGFGDNTREEFLEFRLIERINIC